MECHCLSTVGVPHPYSSRTLNYQGISFIGCKLPTSSPFPLLLPSPLPNQFLQHKFDPVVNQKKLSFHSLKTYRGRIFSGAEKQGWDVGRFLTILSFFDQLPSPGKKLSGPSPCKEVKAMDTTGIVLVAGATGGVGRRVVDLLRRKGRPVRVLKQREGRKMLGEDVDMIVGDITKASTLLPEYFKGVKYVINAVSVIVGPKEGDTRDRAKYSQGIKFFEPEVNRPSFIGMKNLISAVKESVGLRSGKLVFGFEDNLSRELSWGALDDVVMGGVSASAFEIDSSGGQNGRPAGEDLSAYDGLELRIKGDGRRYKFMLRTSRDWDTIA